MQLITLVHIIYNDADGFINAAEKGIASLIAHKRMAGRHLPKKIIHGTRSHGREWWAK